MHRDDVRITRKGSERITRKALSHDLSSVQLSDAKGSVVISLASDSSF